MRFTIDFSVDNAAFEDGNMESEIARIVQGVIEKLPEFMAASSDPWATIRLRDVNGNVVGTAGFIQEHIEE